MFREMAIILYLFVFRLVFLFFKQFPHRKKAIFVTYFGYNAKYTVEALEKQTDETIVIVTNNHTHVTFEPKPSRILLDLSAFSLRKWLRFVYHLATSDKVFVDNYYGFLAVTKFRPNTTCVQLWHAAGAIKRFGLKDASVKDRSTIARNRFKKVYNRFDRVIVGSDEMIPIFEESFGMSKERIWKTGIPRTDFFFNEEEKQQAKEEVLRRWPLLANKKVVLYAPTFRDKPSRSNELPFSVYDLYNTLGDEYVLLMKSHPIIQQASDNPFPEFLIDVSGYRNVNHLLLLTDILITDYSSIPYEFALLEKPMVFYPYDLEAYTKDRGLWADYEDLVPGPIAKTSDELVQVLRQGSYDMDKVHTFKEKWNRYSNGKSSESLVKMMLMSNQENAK